MANTPDMLEIARQATRLAVKAGAREAAAGAARSRRVDVQWRDGKLEKVSEATTRGLGLELYVDGRYSSLATSDLRPEALERFVEDAVALTRKLEPDPYRSLPEPRLYEGQAKVDLELVDPAYGKVDAARRRQLAQAAEAAARAVKGSEAILSVTTAFGDTFSESWRVHTNGFEGATRATDFGISAEVSVRDADGRRPEDWDYAAARYFSGLDGPEAVGRRAAERALGRRGATKGESAVLNMVVENRAAARLVGFLLGPMSGTALQQKQSFLEGKAGQQVGSPLLDLADDPLVVRGLGSRLYDREGIAARQLRLFEAGVLRNFYVDTYYGKKLGMPPTTRGMSNLAWRLGDRGQPGLLAQVKEGILVTGFLGGNSNGTTGDFSLGAQGFRLRGRQIAEPVSEMNVSGNHLELWRRMVAVGNDPYPWSAMRTPTLVFEGVQFAGV
jgi:PmbA protein